MCINIATGTGQSAGSCGTSTLSPCGPPVEMPMTTTSIGPRAARRTAGCAGCGARAAMLRRGDRAAALTLSISSSAMSISRSVASAVGFCTKSIAPASSAASTCSPDSAAMLMMMMGMGRRAICARTKDTPSITGMFRSEVTTSGRSSCTRPSASSPSRAVPTTSTKGLRPSICDTTLRTYAESSTTSTRTISGIRLLCAGLRALDVDERAADFLELERRSDAEQRLGRGDAQVGRAWHQPRELPDDLAHSGLREIDEQVPAEDDRHARARRDVSFAQHVDHAPRGDAGVDHGIDDPPVLLLGEIALPQVHRQAAKRSFAIPPRPRPVDRRGAGVAGVDLDRRAIEPAGVLEHHRERERLLTGRARHAPDANRRRRLLADQRRHDDVDDG